MTLKRYNGSSFETVPFRYYDGPNWRGTPLYRYNGTEWVDAYLNDGLVAYYPFDGDVLDYSGQGNDGTDNSSAGFEDGRIGSDAKSFDGTDDGVTGPQVISATDVNFTVSAWLKPNSATQDSAPVGQYSGTDSRKWLLQTDDGVGNWRFLVYWDGGSATVVDSQSNYSDDTWVHVALTVNDNGDVVYYRDGGQVDSVSDYAGTATVDNHQLEIGYTDDLGEYYRGGIDDARIYDRTLSADEIGHLYQHGRAV